jgi:hypothetical protein
MMTTKPTTDTRSERGATCLDFAQANGGFGQEELWVVFRVGKSYKARPLAVERRLEEMPSSLYGTGLPICSIQFWFLQADNSLAGGCCL